MSKRILGLDLGTNSIGWAVVDEIAGDQFELIKRGVHIFQEGVKIEKKGNESSKASERTGYRSARRLKFRRKLRKIETLKVLSQAEFCPSLSEEELKAWQSKKIYPVNQAFRDWCKTFDPKDKIAGSFKNPYYFRWLVATEILDLDKEEDRFKLGRAFYHMAQRRGFKSNRLDTTQESDGIVKKDITELSEKMGDRTLGQYFWEECYQSGAKIRKVHTSRDEHYLAEFEYICNKQGLSDKLKDDLFKAIFYQRPLKSQKGLVANCPFEPKKKRAPISHPLFEEFRMWQTLNNIKIKTQDDVELRSLSEEEKNSIAPLFFRVSKAQFDFKDIAKKLTPRGQTFGYVKSRDRDAHILFNYKGNQSLSGCPFSSALQRIFGDDFKASIYKMYQGERINKIGEEKTPDDVLHELWHVLFSFDDAGKVKEFGCSKFGLDDELAEKLAKISPKQGYGALSLKAIRKILPYLKQGLRYSHAVFFANLNEVIGTKVEDHEDVKNAISRLIDNHNQYRDEARCVNEFVREYKNSPQSFEQNYDLRKVHEFQKNLPQVLQNKADEICTKIRQQISLNNGNGEYLSIHRLEDRVGDYLIEQFNIKPDLLEKLYHPSKEETYKPAEKHSDGKYYLGDPRISSIRNPVFMRAMYRLKAVVNELLKQGVITEQTQVHVEMARELNDANKRAAIKTWQRINEKKRADFKAKIEEILEGQGIEREASDDEILKYQLWEEQNHICPYTGSMIEPSEFVGENPKYDIEHTIPRSLSCDNSQANKTLCDRTYNREIKKNKIPCNCANYNEILPRIEHWKKMVEELDKKIENKRRASRGATTKEAKDAAIQQRVVLEMDRNYLREKYHRFMMEEVTGGFKNSQLVDTRIITKYARLYLKTVFPTVHSVNGKITDDFRRWWGIKKTRDNHAHHTVDAIVVSCITRKQYEKLAQFYHDYKSYEQGDPSVPRKPHFSKPWEFFTEDMKNLKNEILVSHYAPNHLLKQTKKWIWIKVHGKKKKVLQQGKTARGSLHQDTFYGAIKRQQKNKKGEMEEVIKYVVRKPLADLSEADRKKIVDERIREIALNGLKKEISLKKNLENLKKQIPKVDDIEEAIIREQMKEIEKQLVSLYMLPNKNGNPIPIKKVRICSNLTNPISLKKQRDVSEKRFALHKEKYYVNNDGNYLMAIYEGVDKRGKIIRDYKLINNLSAAKGALPEGKYRGLQCLKIIKNGQVVLLFKDDPAELMKMSQNELSQRLYIVRGIDDDGIKLYFNQEARMTTEVISFMNKIITEENRINGVFDKNGDVKKSKLTTPKGGDVIDRQNEFSYVKFKPSRFNALLHGIDFKMNVLGEVEFMEK